MQEASSPNVLEQLEKLRKLHSEGAIDEAEYQKLKAQIIGGSAVTKTSSMEETGSTPTFSGKIKKGFRRIEEEANKPKTGLSLFLQRLEILFTVLFVLAVIGAFLYPLINEGTTNPCSALETSILRTAEQGNVTRADQQTQLLAAGFMGMLQRASNGSFASALVKRAYPSWPAPIACTVAYFETLDNPQALRDLASENETTEKASPQSSQYSSATTSDSAAKSMVTTPTTINPESDSEAQQAFEAYLKDGPIDVLNGDTFTFASGGLFKLSDMRYALVLEGHDKDQDCHACAGALRVILLKKVEQFQTVGVSKDISGGSWGSPPSWKIYQVQDKGLLELDQSYTEGGTTECSVSFYRLADDSIAEDSSHSSAKDPLRQKACQ